MSWEIDVRRQRSTTHGVLFCRGDPAVTSLYLANIAVVIIVAWAVWARRDTFASRWDRPNTVAIALIGIGAVLDSPWSAIARASYGLTGKFYLLNTVGHIVYLSGLALSLVALYRRLASDDAVDRFMRTRIAPLVTGAALVMLTAVMLSPRTSVFSAYHLYLVPVDGWLTLYWCAHLGTLMVLLAISNFGLIRARSDRRSRMVDTLAAGTGVGVIAALATVAGLLSEPAEFAPKLVWPLTYAATAATAIAHVIAWRHRVASMLGPSGGSGGINGR